MEVRSRSYRTVAGQYTLYVPTLAFRELVSVKRGGIGHDIITTGTPGNRQVLYTASDGGFAFNTAFVAMPGDEPDAGAVTDLVSEKIFIIWKE